MIRQSAFFSLLLCTRSTFHFPCYSYVTLTIVALSTLISGPSDKMALSLPLMAFPQAPVAKPTFLSTAYFCTRCCGVESKPQPYKGLPMDWGRVKDGVVPRFGLWYQTAVNVFRLRHCTGLRLASATGESLLVVFAYLSW